MLNNIHPLLTGELLKHLDDMGHSDVVVVADAFFPSHRLATRFVEHRGATCSEVLSAIVTVLPLDQAPALLMMQSSSGALPVHDDLIASAGVGEEQVSYLDRTDYYDLAAEAYLIVGTGDTRTYANAALRKGVAGRAPGDWE